MHYNNEESGSYSGFGSVPPESAIAGNRAQYPPGTADRNPQPFGHMPERPYAHAQDVSKEFGQASYDPGNTVERRGGRPHEEIPKNKEFPTGERLGAPEWNLRRRAEVRPDEWRVPSYSETQETTQRMYTPGVCVNHPYTRKQEDSGGNARVRGSRLGRFFMAVSLALVCTLLSGAAAYTVMEYRFNRGDFSTINQVVLGGANNQTSSNLTAPIATVGGGMMAQDIYDMACTQVVGIVTEVENAMSMWGGANSTTTVSGSGFIISTDGYILTNYHVIESAHLNNLPLNVQLSDGNSFPAKIVGFEASNDFAVIKIDAYGLNPAIIGNSDSIRVGQTIYAVGNPFGDLVYTMTDGIISALDRVVTVERKSINTFQFSAAVNSGNSGGPIYDTNGEVIGIVTAKLMRGSVEGIGFAIPINDAIEIAAELIEHGYITGRPLIGIIVQTVTSGHAEFYDMVEGAYIRSVSPDSAAERAGLHARDIIVALGDNKIDSREALQSAMRRYNAGDTAIIVVWRNGEQLELSITFDEDLAAGQPQRGNAPPIQDDP